MADTKNKLTLHITKDGETTLTNIPLNKLPPDGVFLVIDENEKKDYLVIGENVAFIYKRMAMRIANSLKKFGYQLSDGTIIGSNCSELVILDKTDKNTSTEEQEQILKEISKEKTKKPTKQTSNTIKKIADKFAKKNVIIKPLNEAITSDAKKTTDVKESSIKGEDKFGILVASILTIYPDIRITQQNGAGKRYIIESPEGAICALEIKGDKIVISPESTFGGEEEKFKIQQKFVKLTKSYMEKMLS